MEDKRVTAEQILAEIGIDIERMAQKVADAINKAQAGASIKPMPSIVLSRIMHNGTRLALPCLQLELTTSPKLV